MADDFYTTAAQRQAAELDAQRAAALADLAQHRATGDVEAAAASVQDLANIDAARANLNSLCENYAASQRAPAQQPQSREEWSVKPPERMNFLDALEVARQSRYAKNLQADDPMVVAGFYEAAKRRSEGR